MSTEIQWALVLLGVLGATGTWFRAYTAWRTYKMDRLFRYGKVTVVSKK